MLLAHSKLDGLKSNRCEREGWLQSVYVHSYCSILHWAYGNLKNIRKGEGDSEICSKPSLTETPTCDTVIFEGCHR